MLAWRPCRWLRRTWRRRRPSPPPPPLAPPVAAAPEWLRPDMQRLMEDSPDVQNPYADRGALPAAARGGDPGDQRRGRARSARPGQGLGGDGPRSPDGPVGRPGAGPQRDLQPGGGGLRGGEGAGVAGDAVAAAVPDLFRQGSALAAAVGCCRRHHPVCLRRLSGGALPRPGHRQARPLPRLRERRGGPADGAAAASGRREASRRQPVNGRGLQAAGKAPLRGRPLCPPGRRHRGVPQGDPRPGPVGAAR